MLSFPYLWMWDNHKQLLEISRSGECRPDNCVMWPKTLETLAGCQGTCTLKFNRGKKSYFSKGIKMTVIGRPKSNVKEMDAYDCNIRQELFYCLNVFLNVSFETKTNCKKRELFHTLNFWVQLSVIIPMSHLNYTVCIWWFSNFLTLYYK